MKKESKVLLGKAINSLVLGIEHFNRPSNRGRTEAVLIFIDQAFEMFLKAAILHRKGKIREPRAKQTIGFDACVRKALSDQEIKFLSNEQALTLQAINSLRDAAQHHILDLAEGTLYLYSQAGLTLFRDLYKQVFLKDLAVELPDRVLPVSTRPPSEIDALFQQEVAHVRGLLSPGKRNWIEATAKLRGLAILDGALRGDRLQPSEVDIRKLSARIKSGSPWNAVFPGVASLELTAKGFGPSLDLRISKKEGVPVQMVPVGTPGAAVLAIKRVDELGFYNLSLTQLAEKVGISNPKTVAIVRHMKLQDDPECYKAIVLGKSKFNRYSQKAIGRIQAELPMIDLNKVWDQYGPKKRRK